MAQRQAKEKTALKFAFVDTRIFADEKEGISIYTKVLKQIDAEFQPAIKELETIAEKINKIAKEFESVRGCPDNKIIDEKKSEQEYLIRVLKYKQEQVKTLYTQKHNEIAKPIEDDIQKEFEAFVKQKGINTIIDLNAGLCIVCNPCEPDITKEFIAYYNTKHPLSPVTNSQTQVKLSEPR